MGQNKLTDERRDEILKKALENVIGYEKLGEVFSQGLNDILESGSDSAGRVLGEHFAKVLVPKKVYLVIVEQPNPGEDYIIEIFNSREKADKFIDEHIFDNLDVPYIEEWIVK